MSYLRYLCLFACGGVQRMLFLWIVPSVFSNVYIELGDTHVAVMYLKISRHQLEI